MLDINHLCYIIFIVKPAMTEITERRNRLMAVATLKKVSVSVKLDDGTDSQGNSKYVGVSLGDLSENNYDADKILAIVDNLEPCLNKSVARVEETKVNVITAA